MHVTSVWSTPNGEDLVIKMARESAERGKAIKRKALNRAKDKESLESIKEYCYDNDRV